MPTYGAEIEKPISTIGTNRSHHISQEFFRRIQSSVPDSSLFYSDIEPKTILGVDNPAVGHIGLDNAYNLQETSTKVCTDLHELKTVLDEDLQVIQDGLTCEGATVINMSIHPLGKTTKEFYQGMVAPKGIYEYIRNRGWDHTVGIDAKAQNSPSTGIAPDLAARAVTTIIGAGATNIALFANSPIAEGKLTGQKESRLHIWGRMLKNSKSNGDRITATFPEQPFHTLQDYFTWMFGPGTNMHFVMLNNADYKTFGDAAVLIDGNPPALEYLKLKEAMGRRYKTQEQIIISPDLSHLEAMQFAQFAGARIRWHFSDMLSLQDFLRSYTEDSLEVLFQNGGTDYMYIEGRDPGANFPDQCLLDVGQDIAFSTIIAPSAIQAGLLKNLDNSYRYISSHPWKQLGDLREASITNGLEGRAGDLTVRTFTKKILDLSQGGSPDSNNHMFAYPEFVLKTNANAADRIISEYIHGIPLSDIIQSRHVISRKIP